MTKFQYTHVVGSPTPPLDYPTLGFILAADDAILDGTLSDPAITFPPDPSWAVYGGDDDETDITRYANPTADPAPETTNGSLLAYSNSQNTYVPTAPASVIQSAAWQAALSLSIVVRPQQAAEATPTLLLKMPPKTSGVPAFEIQHNSFPNNLGAGTGYNQAVHTGWNVERHSGGTPVSGKPAWIMGMERNYYDWEGSLKYGSEFYLEHYSPDGTTSALFRPLYLRVEGADQNAEPYAVITHDIGTPAGGTFQIYAAGNSGSRDLVFVAQRNGITLHKDTTVSATSLIHDGGAGQAVFTISSDVAPVFRMKFAGEASWAFQALSTTQLAISDRSDRVHIKLTENDTAAFANTEFFSKVTVIGGVFTTAVVGTIGSNKDLFLRADTSSGVVSFMNADETAANFQIANSGDINLRNGMVIQTFGASGFTVGGAPSHPLGFHGATPVAQAAHPTTLADVITILTNKGLCAA